MKRLLIYLLTICCVQSLIAQQTTLRETLGQYFRVGCAVNNTIVQHPQSKAHQHVCQQFNSVVAENCMKAETLSPREGEWNWSQADAFVAFGQANGMQVIGHCLIWHSQTADWMFRDQNGDEVSRSVLIQRMHWYIHTVVGRYKGRVAGWDVCNECFESDGTRRQSPWQRIIGDDYIELAFRFAHEADPDAELYYNDYSMSTPAKYQAVCRLVQHLKAKGLRIDAVGMQSHNGLIWPKLTDYDRAIDAIAAAGVKVIISELDLNVLPNPDSFSGAEVNQYFEYSAEMDPYANGMDKATEELIAERWQAFFLLYRKHAHQIDRVTFWAAGDSDSWLNDWPIPGRHAYATLFDRDYNPKSFVPLITRIYE